MRKTVDSIYILIIIISILFIHSCKKDSISLCGEEFLGEMYLLESSRNSIPYNENSNLFFQDSLGNEILFEVDMNNRGYEVWDGHFSMQCEHDPTQQKVYGVIFDDYRYYLIDKSDSLNIRFLIELSVSASSDPFTIDTVSDRLHIHRSSKYDTVSYASNLQIIVNPRNMPENEVDWFEKPVEELQLLDKTFNDVYISNLDSNEYYNYESGLIAFKDWDGKLWVLDRVEKMN